MRFQCVNINCGRPFGWTAKKIIQVISEEHELPVTYEYIVCPYCGGLDFEEGNSVIQKKLKDVPVPPMQMPKPVQMKGQFDPSDLMQHRWKGKKISPGHYEQGKLEYGWDYADQFKPETVDALKKGPVEVDKFLFKITDNLKLVQCKKVIQ